MIPKVSGIPTRTTRLTRIASDLADKISDIVEVEGGSSAEFLDPLVRPEVERRYKRVQEAADKIRKIKESVKGK